MKNKHIYPFVINLLVFTLLAGCSTTATADQTQPVETQAVMPTAETLLNDCDNIFYPMTTHNQWIYRFGLDDEQAAGSQESALALTVSENSGSSAVLAALSYNSGSVTESAVECQDQAILNFPITELKMVLGEMASDIDLEYQSGTYMPSEQEFIKNNWDMEWETNYTANGNLQAYYEGEELSAVLSSSPVKMKWQISGTGQSVQVAAGSFDNVVNMDREISFDITNLQTSIQGNDVNIATTLTVNTELWYAPHIGLIKQDVTGMSIKLYGINFPIEAAGHIELTSYTIN